MKRKHSLARSGFLVLVEAIRMQGNVNIFVAESDFLESSLFCFNRSHFSSNLSQNFVMDKEHKSARHLFEQ
jgi:hypothetical protein